PRPSPERHSDRVPGTRLIPSTPSGEPPTGGGRRGLRLRRVCPMDPSARLAAARNRAPAEASPRTSRRLLYTLGVGFAVFTVAVAFYVHPAFGAAVLGLTATAVYAAVRLDRRLVRDARERHASAVRLQQAEEYTRTILDTAG